MAIFGGWSFATLKILTHLVFFFVTIRNVIILRESETLVENYPQLANIMWIKPEPLGSDHIFYGIMFQTVLYLGIYFALFKNQRWLFIPWLVINGLFVSGVFFFIATYMMRQNSFDPVGLVCLSLTGIDVLFWVLILDFYLRISQVLRVEVINIFVSSGSKTTDSSESKTAKPSESKTDSSSNIPYKNLEDESDPKK